MTKFTALSFFIVAWLSAGCAVSTAPTHETDESNVADTSQALYEYGEDGDPGGGGYGDPGGGSYGDPGAGGYGDPGAGGYGDPGAGGYGIDYVCINNCTSFYLWRFQLCEALGDGYLYNGCIALATNGLNSCIALCRG